MDQLAEAHKVATQAFTDGQFIGAGNLNISVGSGSFSLTVGAEDTLDDIKNAINENTVNDGHVVANIVNGDDGQYLVLAASETGEDQVLKIEVTDDDGNLHDDSGLSRLAFDTSKTVLAEDFSAAEVLGSNGSITVSDGLTDLDIAITDTDTIETIVANINSAGLNLSATLEDNGSGGFKLVLESQNDYPDNKASIAIVSDDDGDDTDALGLSKLAHDYFTGNYSVVNEAVDAKITIDGSITVTSSSNTIENAVLGTSIVATEVHEPDESDTVVVTLDTDGTKEKVEKFVADYNVMIQTVNALTSIEQDEESDEEDALQVGILVSESSLRTMLSQFRRSIGDAVEVAPGVSLSLSVLGITTTKDGTLEIDAEELDNQIETNFDYFSALFTGDDGVATTLYNRVGEYENTGGVVDQKIDTFNDNITRLDEDKEKHEIKMTAYEARLYSQFLAMDLQVAQLQSTGDYLTEQLSSLNKSNN
ncbi:flagellar filament capping protein FliD [Psychrosphaera algicola]|uniref:Flagellar filament capping protein FliD n=1 Tax=Psychrosphaera algicola TaxID=3023714 RepID=A0ABT5F9U1_9GAMM|nr:flagellar filament capping protein FliD [Psychrosphaera sp. G1-22]MDC2888299.1 flagellar filament capping protein FliD [Psychrosphaera sp. G1-22]